MPAQSKRRIDSTGPSSGNRQYYELVKDYLGSESSPNSPGSLKKPRRNKNRITPSPLLEESRNIKKKVRNSQDRYASQNNDGSSSRKAINLDSEDDMRSSSPSDTTKSNVAFNEKSNHRDSPQNSQSKPSIYNVYSDGDSDNDSDEESDEDFDEDEFEDVEIRPVSEPLTPTSYNENDTIAVTIKAKPKSKKNKPRSQVISKEERTKRRIIHMMHIVSMIYYGKVRNNWINNRQIQLLYFSIAPKKIYQELHPSIKNKEMTNAIKSRYFLDGLRHLMEFWIKKFQIISPTGIFKLSWDEIENKEKSKILKKFTERMNKKIFMYGLSNFSGNRDLGAQGFVALLRSLQVRARLIYSLQPPDFTIATPSIDNNETTDDHDDESESATDRNKKKSRTKRSNLTNIPKFTASNSNSKSVLHKIIHSHNRNVNVHEQNNYHLEKLLKQNPHLSPYPVFWAEAWNPYSKKWITIDAINFRILEDIQRISKLEPPMSDERNALLYAIAFDKKNNLKDVTRRYANYYNSKTRKKRITRDNKGYKWYSEVIRSMSQNKEAKLTDIDLLEDEYFTQRNIKEGMPTSIGDFRNHPVYVLESQLRSNEILYPREVCGYVRQKTNSKHAVSIPVYSRENVQELRSARGWFHKGRVLKIGQRALRIKRKKTSKNAFSQFNYKKKEDEEQDKAKLDDKYDDDDDDDDDDDENNVKLYAEFQTENYVPEPIKNGKVPKNAFGNVDVYTDSMVPKGGVLITSKFAAQAAKLIGIDYSPAVVGFSFGYKSSSKPKIGGVVVAKEFEEAVNLVNDHLEEDDVERQRKQTATRAIKAWKLVLAKLRIVERLERIHGEVIEEDQYDINLSSDDDNVNEITNNASVTQEENEDDDLVDTDVYGGGGFLPTDMDQESLRQKDAEKLQEKRKKRIVESDDELNSSANEYDFNTEMSQNEDDGFSDPNFNQGNIYEEDYGTNGGNDTARENFKGGFFLENPTEGHEEKNEFQNDIHEDGDEGFGGGFLLEDPEGSDNEQHSETEKTNYFEGKLTVPQHSKSAEDVDQYGDDFVYDPNAEEVNELKGKQKLGISQSNIKELSLSDAELYEEQFGSQISDKDSFKGDDSKYGDAKMDDGEYDFVYSDSE